MATNFPTSLDTLTNPNTTDPLNSPSHAGEHSDENDAIEALEAKVGVNGSAVTTSLDYQMENHAHTGGADDGGQVDHGGLAGLSDDDHPQYALDTDLTTHAGAADPHTGYRLESADHSHQSTGLQAGQLDHGLALTGLTDDDHTQYLKETDVAAKGDIYAASANDTVGVLTVGTNDQVLTADSTQALGVKWADAAGSDPDIQQFAANGTWTKPTGKTYARVIAIGQGGGGGSGRRGAAGSSPGSGGGGGGGSVADVLLPIASLGATETVTVGTADNGGAAKTSTANGDAGTAGTDTTFGSWVTAKGGSGGGGGTGAAGGSGGSGQSGSSYFGHLGSAGGNGAQNGAGNAGSDTPQVSTGDRRGASGGGGGGSPTAADANRNGAAGGAAFDLAGGTASAGGNGGDGNAKGSGIVVPGSGGGGGAGNATTAGAGGAGGAYGGGGGGGGGGAGVDSGKGGQGGAGYCLVISW